MNETTPIKKPVKRITKKDLALSLHAAGRTVQEIARALETHPSYVANVLAAAGKAPDYSDLYVSASAPGYLEKFRGVLRFKDVEAARESVGRIDELYRAAVLAGDRRGRHQAQMVALVGKNRAEGVGKFTEARVFEEWLAGTLADPAARVRERMRDELIRKLASLARCDLRESAMCSSWVNGFDAALTRAREAVMDCPAEDEREPDDRHDFDGAEDR